MMEKAVIRLISNSIMLHKWVCLSSCAVKYCTSQNTANLLEDIPTCKEIKYQKENLKKYVDSFSSDNNTKDMVTSNLQPNHYAGITKLLKYLNEFYGVTNKNLCYEDIKTSKKFVEMCTLIQQNARNLETFDIIYALKVLFSMNVPSDTAVVQTLLQLTRVLINTLTISQILYLYHTLKVHNETPLAKALLYALHKVSHMQIHVELNRDDIYRTISVLKFACNTNNIQAIRHTLNILSRNQESLNLNDSISVLYALFLIPELTNSYRRLLDQVMNEIMNNHSMLKFNAISFLLAIITMKISEKGLKEFYNKQLINLLCQDCIDKNVNVSDGIKILKRLNKIGFSNIPLLDFLTEKCTEDSNILKTCSHQTIFHFIRALGIANYKPQHWFTVQSIIVNSFLNQNLPIGYVAKVTFYLLSLGCYDEQLLENIFTLYYCNHSHVKDVRTLNNILQLHQCVKSLYPCYDGITLSKNIIDALLSQTDRKIVSFSLADHLEEILGGNRYVKSNLRSKLGHHVEAIVVIQPDGSPMAINDYQDDITYIEDLVSPPDFHKILFLLTTKTSYSRNLEIPSSTLQILVNSLETLIKCNVICINVDKLNTMSIDKQKLHVADLIKLKSLYHK